MEVISHKRRKAWMKRSLLLTKINDDVSFPFINIQWAKNKEELLQVFSLIYREYLKQGYIKKKKASKLYFNIHNLLPSSATLLMKCGREVISTMSIVIDNKYFRLPIDSTYSDEMDNLRQKGRRLCEFCALAISENFRWRNLFLYMFRDAYWYASDNYINDICVMVNPKHVSFYKSILLFDDLGEEKIYSQLDVPAVALKVNLDTWEERLKNAYGELEPKYNLYNFFSKNKKNSLNGFDPRLRPQNRPSIDNHTITYFLDKIVNIRNSLSISQKNFIYNQTNSFNCRPVLDLFQRTGTEL